MYALLLRCSKGKERGHNEEGEIIMYTSQTVGCSHRGAE